MQYFENDRGETVGYAPVALKRVGANQCAKIVERAIRTVCDGSFPTDAEASEALIATVSDETREKLNRLDSEFFEYPDNLTELLFEFVRQHPSTFGLVGAT